ncbi:SRPBCC family protein [Vibrio sp. SCSIO 43136]|uniref:SRPBCC family protein n=1 Tax=Vibrio sp. SCSIO 43136 TaxID=2819101 RepID=UPI0020752144|nr:SRPBCC family protein [Vibrio sp. SCSIO 43136]USD65815.1 SRPBCC family protein [Vibrio sp. SCSIO 43136]
MLDYHVSRSTDINKSVSEVVTYLADFHHWPVWSPWLIMEPDCDLTYQGDNGQQGSSYEWSGDLVGAGKMQMTSVQSNQLEMALSFYKPFKSTATVKFEVAEKGEGCRVTWHMYSKVPWFLFFLKGMFKSMISMDYDRGLRMLKSQLETSSVPSLLTDLGEQTWPTTHYIALAGSGTLEEIGPLMANQIEELHAYMSDNKIVGSAPLFTYYRKMDMSSQHFDYWICCPVEKPTQVGAPFISGTLPQARTYAIEHQGEYQFLGNAWSMAMAATRHKKIKVKRKPVGIEIYLDEPGETEGYHLRTQVMVFKK